MKILGVTGSSGSGKSSVCDIIKKMNNTEIIDADKIVRQLQDN
ncbi:MAG: dephospho-CoA kinase, partial [Clostridia bacterium]